MPASQVTITKGMILNLSSNADVYKRGQRYYRDGKLLSYNAVEDSSGITTIRAGVEGNYKNYDINIKLDDAGSLSSYSCTCESHSIWRGACKHVVAVLFANAEGHARMFSAEKMRQHAKHLTDSLEKIIFDGIDENLATPQNTPDAPIKIVPVLNCGKHRGIYLTFSVGHSRLYIIKSISGFVQSFKNSETVTYGQGLTLPHRREMFDEDSQKLLDFIIREDDMYAEVGKRLSRQYQFAQHPLLASRELYLAQRNIDEFFEIFHGRSLESESDFGEKITLTDKSPPLDLNIRHTPGGIVAHARPLPHRTICSKAYFYILAEGGLHRLPKADGQMLSSLLKYMDEVPAREILISGNDSLRFSTIIFPQLDKIGVVASVEGMPQSSQASTFLAKIYFDSERKDIAGRLEFHYGDIVYNALKDADDAKESPVIRDVVAEYALRRRLLSLGFYESPVDELYKLSGNDMIYAFLHSSPGVEGLKEWAQVFVSEDLQKKVIRSQSPKIGLKLTGDLLKISLEDSDYDIAELLEALEAYRTRKKFFRLKDGRFLNLDDENVAAAAGFLDALDITKKDIKRKSLILPAYRALYVDELTRSSLANTHIKRDENFNNLLSSFQNNTSLTFKVPNGLNKVLREYQKTGYIWLRTLAHYNFGGILADDMGLGKTLQVITLLLSERKKGTSIVVCPTSLLYNWENEVKKFAPQMHTQIISGQPEKRRELLKKTGTDIFITTYDMLKRDIEYYEDIEFSYIIADEAQNIKNPGTQAAKSIKCLKGRVRFALTGTPIENNLMELWSIFDFIMPGHLHTAHKFGLLFESPIIKYNDMAKAAQLRQLIAPFVLRRVKKNVLKELPEKTETTLPAELTPEQKKLYQANLLEAIGALDDIVANNAFADNRMRMLARLTRLRQICCHPGLFLEDYTGGSGKLALAMETIQLALDSGHRVLLFSQFTGMLSLIKDALATSNITLPGGKPATYFYLDGTTKAKDRMEMTSRFNEGERDLFLISLKAGGTGLNLTGADVVIHYDPWWNPSVMDQAADRAHRYGQEKAVQVFNIVAKNSIEEKITTLQEKKRGIIDSVITEGGSFINLLSEEEIRQLFM